MKQRSIAIVGYGTAGQALSVLLSRDDHKVHVFERAPTPGPVGAGFLLQPSGLDVLWQMGLLPQVLQHGAAVRRLYGDTPCGRAVMDMRYAALHAHLHGIGMQRGALFSLLAQAWEQPGHLQADTAIIDVDCAAGRLRDARGQWHGPYDLVIAADGSASSLRTLVQGTRLDREYPWGALWCLLPSGDWPHHEELRQRYVAARKMIGLLPVGTRPGDAQPRLSFFWSLPRDRFTHWERDGLSRWLEEVKALWPQAHERLQGVTDCAQLARAGYRDTVMTHWHRDRLVLAGDSAHAMSPQLGQGVNMALMDALALRDALRGHPATDVALQAYQAQRSAHVGVYQFWSRWLTPVFQSERDVLAGARNVLFKPMGNLPGGRGHMLRVLSGTQRGWWGTLGLSPGFVASMAAHVVEDERATPIH